MPPTPPPTQNSQEQWVIRRNGQAIQHAHFYDTGKTLRDPAEDTLYRQSAHSLSRVSNFFASAFSISGITSPEEGTSDDCPIFLPSSVTCADFEVLLWFQIDYNPDPSQDTLLRAISISRRWSVQSLYNYAFDHFKRKFESGNIHPAIVLGVAREYGIPALISPAVRALASPDISLSSWSVNLDIILHMSVVDIGAIGRMKERLLDTRTALCTPPPDIHDQGTCSGTNRTLCSASWRSFWALEVVPQLLGTNGKDASWLQEVRDGVMNVKVLGMMGKCITQTVTGAIGKPAWKAEAKITDGAVKLLMVEERGMLVAGDISDDEVKMAE
ncbi:hypothetical protein BJ322DRAFT_1104464 [Thelephora terrestris]|uniref:BTB domain-containing protein n=1 Tax=Thelephora terrestris TaxID=56493 RepID=A0A9P6HQQ9_9AGAM|nr:hypothetical protein BJ322DRAFT_1104464 [Thelephora terrestris]